MKKHATLSPCGTYRYWLERSWGECGDFLNVVMLNPSTADAEKDDPTIRKCIGFAKRWGFIGVHVTNLFALRSTDPKVLYTHPDPVGPENYTFLEAGLISGPLTIVAWGEHGDYEGQDAFFMERARAMSMPPRIEALAMNKSGAPRHPLYVPYETVTVPFASETKRKGE